MLWANTLAGTGSWELEGRTLLGTNKVGGEWDDLGGKNLRFPLGDSAYMASSVVS